MSLLRILRSSDGMLARNMHKFSLRNVRWSFRTWIPLCLGLVILYQLMRDSDEGVLQKSSAHTDPRRVLVTGVAGFIGHHVAKALVASPSNKIIGIDNFNDYYDVRLKIDRAYEISRLGVEVYNEDLCTQALLFDLFARHNFTHVVHLGAQAGVRYSLKDPLTYIHSNVECQMALLDVLIDFPTTKLVYASSSSVYGKTSSVPFRLSAATDQPGNMYAATKKTDELLALHYCQAHGLTAVGLRFFTVYGPWGRPDMAVYKFAEAILNRKELPLFQKTDDAPLERDFTYIDDVVNGILATLAYKPKHCGERFNLGFGHPLSVPKLVSHLEEELGVKANVKMLPIPPSEILKTWADISTSTALLGFNPKIPLVEGVRRFATWYKGYRQQRKDERRTGKPTLAERWFKRLVEDQKERGKRYEKNRIKDHNERLLRRLEHERNKYMKWAQEHGQEVPESKKQSFSFFQGLDSSGGDIIYSPSLKNNIEALKQRCKDLDQCVAFNSNGVIKDRVTLRDKWNRISEFTDNTQGLYVADIDVCQADLHDCSKHADCRPTFPGQYQCVCHAAYAGDGHTCLHRYGQFTQAEMEREFFPEYFNIFNVTKMKQSKDMVFIQGLDSPGGDYMVAPEFTKNLSHLKSICIQDPICIGVNTNGIMKKRILPADKWTKWTADPEKGIFVYDLNYCLFDNGSCPENAECKRQGPADYRCVCDEGYRSSGIDNTCKPSRVPTQIF